jgi:signal transduction histidine kinase
MTHTMQIAIGTEAHRSIAPWWLGRPRGAALGRLVVGAGAVLALAAAPASWGVASGTPILAAGLACSGLLALRLRCRGHDRPAALAPGPVAALPTDPERVLFDAAAAVGHSLDLEYVGIELADPASRRYEWGRTTGATTAVELTYGDCPLGRLRAAARGGCALTGRERRGVEAHALQIALIAHSVGLSQRAIRSQEQIVAAREEERRYLRRDLHDSLGPSLAALTLTLDAARNLLDRDPPAVQALLAGMREQSQHAIADIRRLASGLRPPTLDQLGLAGAISDCAEQHMSRSDLRVRVEAPERVPALPAAVEVATLRIVQDALANVHQHAHARHCTVRLAVDDVVVVEIEDDGAGLPAGWAPGRGVASMRERALEVGGVCAFEALAGAGVRVSARLPLSLA